MMTKWGQNRRVLVVSLFKQTPSLEQASVCSGESFFSSASVWGITSSTRCDYFESNPRIPRIGFKIQRQCCASVHFRSQLVMISILINSDNEGALQRISISTHKRMSIYTECESTEASGVHISDACPHVKYLESNIQAIGGNFTILMISLPLTWFFVP